METPIDNNSIKLTQYSHGAGCGCKISPKVLNQIIGENIAESTSFPQLLVGNEGRDDAAVMDLGNGQVIISTTDFFTPIVDDAFDFGRIAAANSISDVYAMGGKPIMAIAILGWPVDKLPVELAGKVLDGGRSICKEAGIPLAGGHSIDSPEPIFGLAVTGLVDKPQLKRNNTAKLGDCLFLTKPLGVGVLATAQKRGHLKPEHEGLMVETMVQLNRVGEALSKIAGVNAMTDVTGFGLLGHLVEMTEGTGLSSTLFYDKIPVLKGVTDYISQSIIPDATTRNWSSYGEKIGFGTGVNVLEAFSLLPDPQTNGGLLISVNESAVGEVQKILEREGLGNFSSPIGKMVAEREKAIYVELSHHNEFTS